MKTYEKPCKFAQIDGSKPLMLLWEFFFALQSRQTNVLNLICHKGKEQQSFMVPFRNENVVVAIGNVWARVVNMFGYYWKLKLWKMNL